MVAGARGAYRDSVIRDLLRPWRESATWWALTYLLMDAFVGALTFTMVVSLVAISVGLLITFPLALPFVWLLFVLSRLAGRLQRSRIAALLDVRLDDPIPPPQARRWWGRLVERVKAPGPVAGDRCTTCWRCRSACCPPPWPAWRGPGRSPCWCCRSTSTRSPATPPSSGCFDVSQGVVSACGGRRSGPVGLVVVAPWLTKLPGRARHLAIARRLLSAAPQGRAGRAGHAARDQPGRRRRHRRGRAPPHRARPPRRRPAAARRPGHGPRHRPRAARPRPRGRARRWSPRPTRRPRRRCGSSATSCAASTR